MTVRFAQVRVHVEFMDGEKRTYEPVGGAIDSPRISGDGMTPVLLEMGYKSGEFGDLTHIAALPLSNIREYRIEAM